MTVIPQTIVNYCTENGWTDPQLQAGQWWAFPPNAVMPLPVPVRVQPKYYLPSYIGIDWARPRHPSLVEMGEQYGRIPTSDRPSESIQVLSSGRYYFRNTEGVTEERTISPDAESVELVNAGDEVVFEYRRTLPRVEKSFVTEIVAVDEFRRFYRVTTEYFIIGIYEDDNFRGKPSLRITPQGQWADIARLQLALESISFQNSGDVATIDIKTNYQDLPIPQAWECIRHYELGVLDFSNPDPLPYRLTLHLR